MKTQITDGKKYLALFIAFSFFLCATRTALISLGTCGERQHEGSDAQSEEHSDRSAQSYPVIIIDAGHGGEDGGTVGKNGVYEKDVNLAVALYLSASLEDMGITTLLTRNEDILLYDRNSDYEGQKKAQDLATRKRIAEECDNAIFVSIHMNSFPEEKYKGLQVYYSENNTDSFVLAQRIQGLTAELIQPDNTRMCKAGKNIYLLERLNCPALLIECGFLSNPEECALLSTAEYQKKLSQVLAEAIYDHVTTIEKSDSQAEDTTN